MAFPVKVFVLVVYAAFTINQNFLNKFKIRKDPGQKRLKYFVCTFYANEATSWSDLGFSCWVSGDCGPTCGGAADGPYFGGRIFLFF